MKLNVLQVGFLSVLLTAGLPSEGRNKGDPTGNGSAVGRAVKGMNSRGGRAVSRGSEQAVRDAAREAERTEQRQDARPSVGFSRPGELSLEIANTNQTKPTTKREAESIIDTLSTKVEITADMKRTLTEVITENSQIGQSAKLLAEKMRDPTASETIKTEDLQVIVEYLTQVKDMQYNTRNEENPNNTNILMDLATNAMEMATWTQNPRNNATSLLRQISQAFKTQPTKEGALDVALHERGYLTPEARRKRKREIRRECRR